MSYIPVFLTCLCALSGAQSAEIVRIEPPEAGFYSKKLDYKGIPIKAHEEVSDEALFEARRRLARMLGRMPNAVRNLVEAGAELHIIGRKQVTSDLPENRSYKGKPYDGKLTIDERTRGTGGLWASCGEENLLRLPEDRYKGRDICLHEFAHCLQNYGLSKNVQTLIDEQYRRSLENGLWKTAYAAVNSGEFFAELTMWYFGTEGDRGKLSPPPARGREGLRAYDPEAFALLDGIYTGRIKVERKKEYARAVKLKALSPDREVGIQPAGESTKTSVRFKNLTSQEVQLFWLPGDGTRKPYGAIPAGGTFLQHTFAGHSWLITTADGRGLAIFVAETGPGIAEIKERE
jgi:hypothetical protein